jgi:hypothetical protein
MAGALDAPVGAGIPLLVTSVALLASLSGWWLFHRDQRRGDPAQRLFDGLIALAPAAMIAAASSTNASAATLALLSGLLLCGLATMVACEIVRPQSQAGSGSVATRDDHMANDAPPVQTMHSSTDLATDDPGRPEGAATLHEHFERRILPGGREEIEAVLIARFLPGQRQTAVHLPIHPVLPHAPHVECEPIDDSAVSVQVTSSHGYGVRLEARRTAGIAAEAAVPIGLLLTTCDTGVSAA